MEQPPPHSMISVMQEQLDMAQNKCGSLMEQLNLIRNKVNAKEAAGDRKSEMKTSVPASHPSGDHNCYVNNAKITDYQEPFNTRKESGVDVYEFIADSVKSQNRDSSNNETETSENEEQKHGTAESTNSSENLSKKSSTSSSKSSSSDGKSKDTKGICLNDLIKSLESFKEQMPDDSSSSSESSDILPQVTRRPKSNRSSLITKHSNQSRNSFRSTRKQNDNNDYQIIFPKALSKTFEKIIDENIDIQEEKRRKENNKPMMTLGDFLHYDSDTKSDKKKVKIFHKLKEKAQKEEEHFSYLPDSSVREKETNSKSFRMTDDQSKATKEQDRKSSCSNKVSFDSVSVKSKGKRKKSNSSGTFRAKKGNTVENKKTKMYTSKNETNKINAMKKSSRIGKQAMMMKKASEKNIINMSHFIKGCVAKTPPKKTVKNYSTGINYIERNKELLKIRRAPKAPDNPVPKMIRNMAENSFKNKIENFSNDFVKNQTETESNIESFSEIKNKVSENKANTGAIIMKRYPPITLYKNHPENLFLKNEVESQIIEREKDLTKRVDKEVNKRAVKYLSTDKGGGGDCERYVNKGRQSRNMAQVGPPKNQAKLEGDKVKLTKSSHQMKGNQSGGRLEQGQQGFKGMPGDPKNMLKKLEQNLDVSRKEASGREVPKMDGSRLKSRRENITLNPTEMLSEIEKQICKIKIKTPNDLDKCFSQNGKSTERSRTAFEPRDEPYEPKYPTKNVESPTNKVFIVSNNKNVFTTFPFILGQSTSRSYHLGVNIQQTMSKLKMAPTNAVLKNMSQMSNITDRVSQHTMVTASNSYSLGPKACPACVARDSKGEEEEELPGGELRDPWDTEGLNKKFIRCTCMPRNTVNFKTVMQQLFSETSLLKTPSISTTLNIEETDFMNKESNNQLINMNHIPRRSNMFTKVLHRIQRLQERIGS